MTDEECDEMEKEDDEIRRTKMKRNVVRDLQQCCELVSDY